MSNSKVTKVIVTADDKTGLVIVPSQKNPEWGHIRVKQSRMVVEGGFAELKPLSALIPGKIVDLKGFGWHKGQEVDGKIVIKESLTPFNKKEPERDYKLAGKSGVICRIGDDPIYRKHFYTFNEKDTDVTLDHTNSEEIRAAYEALNKPETAETAGEEAGEESAVEKFEV